MITIAFSPRAFADVEGFVDFFLDRDDPQSAASAQEIDMNGYEHILITPMGLYSVFKRKALV